MKNIVKVVGIIAVLAIIGLVAGCSGQEADPEDQISVTVIGIPAGGNGKFAVIGLYDNLTNPNVRVALGNVAKKIVGGKVTNDMFFPEGHKNAGKAFGDKGDYAVIISIYNTQDSDGSVYTGRTMTLKAVAKGENHVVNAGDLAPDIDETIPDVEGNAPAASDFGTYTASVSYKDANGSNARIFTETIVLTADEFYIKDNTNGDNATPDDLRFRITKWEDATTPSTQATDYPNAYKFTGKMVGAYEDNTASTVSYVYGDYIPSSKTAPGTTMSDVKADASGPTFFMYIYFGGNQGNIKFVRTAFVKSGTPAVVTDDAGTARVYSKNN